jgi:hypothetical protein
MKNHESADTRLLMPVHSEDRNMRVLGFTLLMSLAWPCAAADTDGGLSKKMLPIYIKEAEAYSMAAESDPKKELEFRKEPVFEWLNRSRGDTQGALFVWLHDGRPAAIATIFSWPHEKLPGRVVAHELHALDPEKLLVTRPKDALHEWKPEVGLARKELPDSPEPATTAGARTIQIRKLAEEFKGHEIDNNKRRWDLRLLPTPLFRYPTAKTGVLDGALFAIISDGGTDPEVLLVIEAREDKGKVRWEYACGRFSDWELHVTRKDKEVYSSIPSADDPSVLYRVYPEKIVTTEGKVLARMKGYGEIIPIVGK